MITKHPGTGGLVSIDTVTAQLLYEVQGSLYLGPDVSVDLRSIRLAPDGPDRVAISGVRGVAPPQRLKVGVNTLGGHRNQVEFVLTGLDIDAKAAWLRTQLEAALPDGPDYHWSTYRVPAPDSPTEEGAACLLRLSARSTDPDLVGRRFTAPAIELALASYPGFHVTAPPGRPAPYGIFATAYVDRSVARERVHHHDGRLEVLEGLDPASLVPREGYSTNDGGGFETVASATSSTTGTTVSRADSSTTEGGNGRGTVVEEAGHGRGTVVEEAGHGRLETPRPLGDLVHARSGDKGGDANVGLWIPQGRPAGAVDWLLATVTPEWIRTLLPEAAGLDVDVTPLPNLRGVNVVIHGLLGEGVAASTRFDPQAKALGEWLRSRHVAIPGELCDE